MATCNIAAKNNYLLTKANDKRIFYQNYQHLCGLLQVRFCYNYLFKISVI